MNPLKCTKNLVMKAAKAELSHKFTKKMAITQYQRVAQLIVCNRISVKKCAVGITKLYEIIVNDEKPVQACVSTKYNGISEISFSFRVSKKKNWGTMLQDCQLPPNTRRSYLLSMFASVCAYCRN